MTVDLKGKVAVITGAASGMGRATALKLSQSGAKVGLVDLKEEHVRKVKEQIENNNGEAMCTDADISNPKEVEASILQFAEKWGHRSEEHTSELQSRGHLVCRLLLEKKKKKR